MKRFRPKLRYALLALLACAASPTTALAQVWAIEGVPWQFDSAAEKANKGLLTDMVERKKGGYYDSFKATYNITNNTHIRRQYNCDLSSTAMGSVSEGSQSSAVSSPLTSNTSGNYLDSTGNSSHSGPLISDAGRTVGDGSGAALAATEQSNTGAIVSRVQNSPSNARSAPVNASGGRSEQALNVHQSNTGTQTASLSGSTACNFGSGGVALN